MTSIPSWAVKGAKVVCVDDAHLSYCVPGYRYSDDGLDGLSKGEIYTIRDALVSPFDGAPSIRLVEITRARNWSRLKKGEPGFAVGRFRPLVTKTQEQDVAQFAPLLNAKSLERT
jgi:hypothetical protein